MNNARIVVNSNDGGYGIEIVERDIRTMHEWLTATVYIEIVEGETLEQCTSG